jgi:hypothetical protein
MSDLIKALRAKLERKSRRVKHATICERGQLRDIHERLIAVVEAADSIGERVLSCGHSKQLGDALADLRAAVLPIAHEKGY